jgi:crotonobetainyl-CoA:carnitine CoA-transferase CaiB-like acyl-CoA transferase
MAGTALDGIRVLDCGTMVAGPYCAKLLADLGADVIKIEPPEGDPARRFGPFPQDKPHPEKSALFLYNNTSKRGITLDLASDQGKALFRRLLHWADVLIDNHPTGYMAALGFGDAALRDANPRLVFTTITPYGRTGPRAKVSGDELTLVHAGGLGNLLPSRSKDIKRAPVKPGGFHVAYHAAIAAALPTLAALLGAGRSGNGCIVDVSMQEVVLGSIRPNVTGARYHGSYWGRVPDRPPAMGRMQTRDGYLVLGAVEDHHFAALREVMGNPPWLADDRWLNMAYRIHHSPEIAPLLDAWMAQQEKEHVHQESARRGIPLGPVNNIHDLLQNRQYAFRGYFTEIEHPEAGKLNYPGWPYLMTGTPPRVSRPAPLLGQHNQDVAVNVLGCSAREYRAMLRQGAFGRRRR